MLEARFHDCEAGWIRLTLTHGEQEATVHASAHFDSFPEFIRWLETLVTSAPQEAFTWDGEGEGWEFRVKNGVLTISDPYGDKGTFLSCPTSMEEAVRTLYAAFLSFIQSDAYRPEEWERFSNGEIFEKATLGQFTREEILEGLLAMDDQTLVETEFKMNPSYLVNYRNDNGTGIGRFADYCLNPDDKSKTFGMIEEPIYMDLPEGFGDWEEDKRRQWLEEYMEKSNFNNGFGGAKLHELRSFRIERTLQLADTTIPEGR